jgi:hypothetical protein
VPKLKIFHAWFVLCRTTSTGWTGCPEESVRLTATLAQLLSELETLNTVGRARRPGTQQWFTAPCSRYAETALPRTRRSSAPGGCEPCAVPPHPNEAEARSTSRAIALNRGRWRGDEEGPLIWL